MAQKYSFDIDAACRWARANATAKSRHICATNVKKAMQAGGIPYIGGYNGCDMDRYCNRYGFKQVDIGLANGAKNPSRPQKGDIACIKHGQYGHTCIYDGVKWYSDFVQNNCIPYSSNYWGVSFWRWTDNPQFSGYDPNIKLAAASDDMSTASSGVGVYGDSAISTTFEGSYGDLFSDPANNSFKMAAMTNTTDSKKLQERTRIYSTNDATIILDELSLEMNDNPDASTNNTSTNNSSTNS